MNSTQLWRAVRREFKRLYPTGTIHRIENTLERGTPDVILCANGTTAWVELKGLGDEERPLQTAFRKKWGKAGGCAVVLSLELDKEGDPWFVVTDRARNKDVYCNFETVAEAIMCIVGG